MSKIPLVTALFLSVLCTTSPADTVTLSSGEKLQGKVSAENDSEITLDIKVSETISDQKIIKRSEIQKIEKTPQDELDFQQIKDLKPDPLISQPAVINAAIGRLNGFLTAYPQSAHVAAVKSAIDLFQKEKEHVAAGEVKYFGRWISKDVAADRKVQLDAVALYTTMRDQSKRGDFIGAMNTFAQLEKEGANTRIYPQAVTLACKLLEALSQQVNHGISKLKHDVEEWQQGYAVTPETQKPQLLAAQKADQDKYDAAIEASQKAGLKWMPLLPRSAKSLDGIAALSSTEYARLNALPVARMEASIQAVDKAHAAMDAQDFATADAMFKQATTLWPQNEAATYWQKVLVDRKAEEVKRAEIAAKATPKPTATPKPSASAAKPAVAVAPEPSDEDKPAWYSFFLTITGAMTVVGGAVVLLVIATVAQKMKKPKSGDIEV